jgi:hypothetical protein
MAGPLEGFRVLEIGGIGPVLAAVLNARQTGIGQVVDTAMAAKDIDALVDQGVIADH